MLQSSKRIRSRSRVAVGLALLMLIFFCASGRAVDVPDPAFSEVSPGDQLNGLVACPPFPEPIPVSIVTITVRNNSNAPVIGANVEIVFDEMHDVCDVAPLTGTTDGGGKVVIVLNAGCCTHDTPLAVIVKANGVTIRAYRNLKSPDYNGSGGDGVVDLGDLIPFSNQFLDTATNDCHDYNNNGDTDLGDLIIFSTPFSNGNNCGP